MSIFDSPAIPLAAREGQEIVVHGAIHPSDGSVIDATATSGGPSSVDGGGFIDFEAGGFHVVSRDAATHDVHAVATGGANACASYHVAAPCLPLRTVALARSRLQTVAQFEASFHDGGAIELTAPDPAHAGVVETRGCGLGPTMLFLGTVGLIVMIVAALGVLGHHLAVSPRARLLALLKRVEKKASSARAPLAAPLAPVIDGARRAVRTRAIVPESRAGSHLMMTLDALEKRLDAAVIDAQTRDEARVAQSIVEEIEIATRAAEEAARLTA